MFSKESLTELKAICRTHCRELSDDEAISVGERIVRFLFNSEEFQEEVPAQPVQPHLTDLEARALAFINESLEKGIVPSVRSVAKAIGLSSSRSGHRVIQQLKQKGMIGRFGKSGHAESADKSLSAFRIYKKCVKDCLE